MELTGNVAYADIDTRETVLSRWYDAYGTDVLRLCCFYLGSRADAEDAAQETFLKAHGCEATMEEVKAILEAKQNEDAPLSLDELENSAGGNCVTTKETILSVVSAGIGCATFAIASATDKGSHVGQRNENEGRICNKD